jgi:hypothetical protein
VPEVDGQRAARRSDIRRRRAERRSFDLLHRRLLAKRLDANGTLDAAAVATIATSLADRFPPA